MAKLWAYCTGPKLYRYMDSSGNSQAYESNPLEAIPEYIFGTARFCIGLAQWGWPFALPFVLKQAVYSTVEQLAFRVHSYAVYSAGAICLLLCAACVRTLGRAVNPTYTAFAETLRRARGRPGTAPGSVLTTEDKEALSRYDFDFWAWPVEFKASALPLTDQQTSSRTDTDLPPPPHPLDWLLMPASRFVTQTIGVRLTYPGCTAIMNALVRPTLQQTRVRLVSEHGIVRYKLLTAGGHELELFFADRRHTNGGENGDTLIVCCEGNAGYPEIGCTGVPLEAGFSVIGWNHPGFAGSTGLPFPETERQFIETVLEFSQQRLNFRLEDTALLAWSIGGFTATWAAMRHPNIKYIVLDATFDNIEELAVKAMPKFASQFVRYTVRRHMHLDNASQLCGYPGPVKLIRRTQDEMITTGHPSNLRTNRGNELLLALLKHRYPSLLSRSSQAVLLDYLALGQKAQLQEFLRRVGYPGDAECAAFLRGCCEGAGIARLSYPARCVGAGLPEQDRLNLLLFLAGKLLVNMESTHCTPLTPGLFRPPWSEAVELSQDLQQQQQPEAENAASSQQSSESDDASWEPV